MAAPFGRTADGFETQFGTNHLGHFVLVNRIASLVKSGGRVVIVASSGHRMAPFSLDDLNFESKTYEPWAAYAQSKTANILFAVELDRRLEGARHPRNGTASRRHQHRARAPPRPRHDRRHVGADQRSTRRRGQAALPVEDDPQGAATSVWAGFVAPADAVGGRYCENCHVSEVTDAEISPISEGCVPTR